MTSIERARREADAALAGTGENKNLFSPVKLSVVEKILVQYGAEFKQKATDYANKYKIVDTGGLVGDNILSEVIKENGDAVLRITIRNYGLFIDKGVRGVKSSRNAPNSPYQFRKLGVGDDMRESLRGYISRGRGVNTKYRKYSAIGREQKGRSLEDQRVNTLGYLIKAYGIKSRPYLTDAYNEVFKNVENVITEAVGQDIVITLSGINLK